MSVDLEAVLEELTERRRNQRSTSVTTMTLISFIADTAISEVVRERTRELADKHPSRVIILDACRDWGTHPSTWTLSRGEWIDIGVRGLDGRGLTAAAQTLSLPNAPLVLHWAATGVGSDERFAALAKCSQIIVCNSSLVEPGTAALRELCRYAVTHTDGRLHDLAYLRLAPWQEAIASFFDDADAAEELMHLQGIEVHAGTDAEAYYLLGWLASRLAWTPRDARRFDNRFGKPIEYAMTRTGEPRRVGRVALAGRSSRFSVEMSVSEGAAMLATTVTGARARAIRRSPLTGIDVPTMLERAILLSSRADDVFHQSLEAVAALLDAAQR